MKTNEELAQEYEAKGFPAIAAAIRRPPRPEIPIEEIRRQWAEKDAPKHPD